MESVRKDLKITVQGFGTPVPVGNGSERMGSTRPSASNHSVLSTMDQVRAQNTATGTPREINPFLRKPKLAKSPPTRQSSLPTLIPTSTSLAPQENTQVESVKEGVYSNKTTQEQQPKIAPHTQIDAINIGTKKAQAWDQLGKLILHLQTFIKGKTNVHMEIRRTVASIGSAYMKAEELEKTEQQPVNVNTMEGTRALPTLSHRTYSETTAKDTEAEDDEASTPNRRVTHVAKRKKRTSPVVDAKILKKVKQMETTPQMMEVQPGRTEEEWQQVTRKKNLEYFALKQLQKRKQRKRTDRPDALIVRPKEKENYAEILKRVKNDVPLEKASDCVDKIRRTATGDMLIVLTKDHTDKVPGLQNAIAELLGEEATVLRKGPEKDLEIRDIDELTSKEEILEALQRAAGGERGIALDAIKSLRKAYGGTQTALVRLGAVIARTVTGERHRLKIGWVNCRIRVLERRPLKCFKCWHYGHIANACQSEINRSNLCIKCGMAGHKVAECINEAHCVFCVESGNKDGYAHITSGSRCPIYKKALETSSNKRR